MDQHRLKKWLPAAALLIIITTLTFLILTKKRSILEEDIFWGRLVEDALPPGYHDTLSWNAYLDQARALRLEPGCGRMQNRLILFEDGLRGCVRYRQNTDQIQGELFSFYLGQVLELRNLAPSSVRAVNLSDPLWRDLGEDVAAAQWNSNKVVVVTEYVEDLLMARIPAVFRAGERRLNKEGLGNVSTSLVELAQWSDLIVFDYLTANLDRVVNNLYNFQWNVNIMDAPAHNLARKGDLLLFLDNESGLLHGYRLLKKYEVYHRLLLENLCIFRRRTAEIIRDLWLKGDVGERLQRLFDNNEKIIKDLLPMLPEKSVKILNDRLGTVYQQINKCEKLFKL